MAMLTDVRDLSAIGYGFMASKALFVALDLELFTQLAPGPLSAQELERRTGCAEPPAHAAARLHQRDHRSTVDASGELLPGLTGLVTATRR